MTTPARAPHTRYRQPTARVVDPDLARRPAMVAAGFIFLVAAVLTAGRVTFLSEWFPGNVQRAQTLGIAALQSLLGGGLLLGSEGVRKFVLWISAFGAVASAVACAMVWEDLPLAALAATGFVAGAAAFLLLVGQAPGRARVWTCVLAILVSWVGSVLLETGLLRLPDTKTRRLIAKWAQPERVFDDPQEGVRLALPDDWVMLAPENPVLSAGDTARAVFAHQEADCLAALIVEDMPEGVASLDHYIDLVTRVRRSKVPSYQESSRDDGKLGLFETRVAEVQWKEDRFDRAGRIVAWQDGWRYFALSGVFLEQRADAGRVQFEALLDALTLEPLLSREIAKASAAISKACPHLSPDAITTLLRKEGRTDVSPALAFRLSYRDAGNGLESLNAAESSELGEIMSATFSKLGARDRAVLGNYLDRIRRNRATEPEEDERMCALMRGALERIPQESLSRLRDLFGRAAIVGSIY